jgi:hypothetical protein
MGSTRIRNRNSMASRLAHTHQHHNHCCLISSHSNPIQLPHSHHRPPLPELTSHQLNSTTGTSREEEEEEEEEEEAVVGVDVMNQFNRIE